MPNFRSIHGDQQKSLLIDYTPAEAMRLRQVIKDAIRQERMRYLDEYAACRDNALVNAAHLQTINSMRELLKLIEDPLVVMGYLETITYDEPVAIPPALSGSYSLRDPGGVVGDNPVGSGRK